MSTLANIDFRALEDEVIRLDRVCAALDDPGTIEQLVEVCTRVPRSAGRRSCCRLSAVARICLLVRGHSLVLAQPVASSRRPGWP